MEKESSGAQTNQVRQILMNELGLTREYVRGLAQDVVETTIQRQLEGGHLERYVKEAVKETLSQMQVPRDRYTTESALLTLAKATLKDEVAKLVNQCVNISIMPSAVMAEAKKIERRLTETVKAEAPTALDAFEGGGRRFPTSGR